MRMRWRRNSDGDEDVMYRRRRPTHDARAHASGRLSGGSTCNKRRPARRLWPRSKSRGRLGTLFSDFFAGFFFLQRSSLGGRRNDGNIVIALVIIIAMVGRARVGFGRVVD